MRCKIKTAPSPPLTPSLLQVCEQLMTMHLAGRRSAAGKPSPGKPHLLRLSQLAAGVPDAMVSHTKGHADVSPYPGPFFFSIFPKQNYYKFSYFIFFKKILQSSVGFWKNFELES